MLHTHKLTTKYGSAFFMTSVIIIVPSVKRDRSQGCKNRVSAPPVSAMRTTENEYTGVHADNQVLPTFEILILAYILSFHDE